jgi:hypothetical protein
VNAHGKQGGLPGPHTCRLAAADLAPALPLPPLLFAALPAAGFTGAVGEVAAGGWLRVRAEGLAASDGCEDEASAALGSCSSGASQASTSSCLERPWLLRRAREGAVGAAGWGARRSGAAGGAA